MGEIAVLAQRHLRSALRTRASRIVGLVYLTAVLAAIWAPSGETAAGSTFVLFALVALTLLVYGVASGVGNGLPDDRRSGRVEWLRTTSPPQWKHRAALVVAGFALAVLAGVGGGFVAALATVMVAPDYTVRQTTDVPLPAETAMLARQPEAGEAIGPPLTIVLPRTAAEGALLELDLRPRFENAEWLVDFADLRWQSDTGVEGEVHASVWRALRIVLPAGTREVILQNRTRRVHVRVREARLLAPSGQPLFTMLLGAGLLLGIVAGTAAPVGVVISRFTSGTTASASAFLVLLYGTLEGSLLELVEGVDIEGAARFALALLGAVGFAAPDLPTVALIGEYASGRAAAADVGAWLPALLLYTAAATTLAAVPLPTRWTERTLTS